MVTDLVEKEDKKDNKKEVPREISQEILKKIFKNLLRAIGIMCYFMVLNLAYTNMQQERIIGDIEVFAGAFLIVGMIFLEKAYKEDSGSTAITGIELLFLSLHTLSIIHVITLFKYDFRFYILTSSYVISIYYVFKAIMLYTKGRKEYLNSLSDISEIVKKDQPIKKEARKRSENIQEETQNEEQIEEKSQAEQEIKDETQEEKEIDKKPKNKKENTKQKKKSKRKGKH